MSVLSMWLPFLWGAGCKPHQQALNFIGLRGILRFYGNFELATLNSVSQSVQAFSLIASDRPVLGTGVPAYAMNRRNDDGTIRCRPVHVHVAYFARVIGLVAAPTGPHVLCTVMPNYAGYMYASPACMLLWLPFL